MNSVVILIIVHKSKPSETELASLFQCQKILDKYPIVLVCPEGLDVNKYSNIAPGVSFDFIDPKWQSSYAMFNRLKIEPFLYERYKEYTYILFYELDAWVFRDELEYWCNKCYDYIGAPWFDAYELASPDSKFFGVGNGGFSLRKVQSHLKALQSFGYIRLPKILLKQFLNEVTWHNFIELVAGLTIRNNVHYLLNDYKQNEDHFWGKIVAKRFDWFKVPDMETASHFSMELNAPYLYKKMVTHYRLGVISGKNIILNSGEFYSWAREYKC